MEDGRKLSGVVGGGGMVEVVKEAAAAVAVVAGWGGPGLFDTSVGRIGEDQQSGKRKDRGWRRAKFRFWTYSSTSLPSIASLMFLHWIPHLKGIFSK